MNREAQLENSQRLSRAKEHYRDRLLSEHERQRERNMQVKRMLQAYQNHVRSRSVAKSAENEETFQHLVNLRKRDPYKPDQRKALEKEIVELNSKLGLGLALGQ